MNGFQKTIAGVLFSVVLSMPVFAAQQIMHRDTFWGNTHEPAKMQLADLFPNAKNLEEILPLIIGALNNAGPLLGAINVSALPGNPPTSNAPLTDIQTVTAAINPASLDLGSAVTSVVNLTDSPSLNPSVAHTDLYNDLIAVKTAIGPAPTLGSAVNAELLLMGLLASSGVINTDLLTLRTSLGPLPTTLQANITADLAYINTFALPGNPPSSGVIYTDLVTTKGRINPSPTVLDIGSSITTEIGFIATQLLPGNPPSSGIIDNDLVMLLSKINPAGVTLGNGVSLSFGMIGVASLLPIAGSSGNIFGDLQIMISRIVLGAPNIGNAVMQILNRIFPGSADLTSAINSSITLIGTSALGIPSSLNIRDDIQALINNVFFLQPSLGAAIVAYRQALCTLIGLGALIPPVNSTGNPTQDMQLMVPEIYTPGGPSIGFAVQQIRNQTTANITLIGTGNLIPPTPSVNISTDIGVILSRMTNPALANLGSAVNAIIGMIGAPTILVPPYNVIGTDIGIAKAAINPAGGNLIAAINADLTLIGTGSLFPSVLTTGVISLDLGAILSKIFPAAGNLGVAITNDMNLIDVPSLAAPGNVSSTVISTDLVTAIGRVNPTPNITLGNAITTGLNLIDTVSLALPNASSTVISTDLVTVIGRINPTPNITLGNSVTTVLNFISTVSLPGNPGSSNIIDTDLGTVRNLIHGASANLGGAVNTVSILLGPVNLLSLQAKTLALLVRLNAMSAAGVVIPPLTPPQPTIDLWLAQFGF